MAAPAVDFTTGQAARLVIGQATFTAQYPGADQNLVGGVSGLAYANNMLFVADSNRIGAIPINHRVLIFQNISGQLPKPTDELFYTTKCPACLGQANVVLGQPDFITTTENIAADPTTLRLPTAVASDGIHLVVADTNHNRVLIWNHIPTTNDAPADVVAGQADFKGTGIPGSTPNAKSMRGPQGVWIDRITGRLYVADTQNHRVLIYNSIPTTNGVAADLVLGQPNFTTFVESDISQANADAKPTNMLNPVSVTTDPFGRVYVADLGHNRVLIWNSTPRASAAPADVAVGQPDLTSSIANNAYSTDSAGNLSKVMCDSNGTDSDGKATYPEFCNSTISFPRFALTDGANRLFVADGGNDRVLVFSSIPTQSGTAADYIIGEIGGQVNQAMAMDAADSLRTPMSMAWDGTNLYVSDAYNRRITVYSMGETTLPYTAVRNSASQEIYAVGQVTLSGTIKDKDTLTLTIAGKDYKLTIGKNDTLTTLLQALMNLINAGDGDPNVLATINQPIDALILTARQSGSAGNSIAYSTTLSTGAVIAATTAGSSLAGGMDAAQIAPGTMVNVLGSNLSDSSASAPDAADPLPDTLAGTQVYFNGIRAPLMSVSPDRIVAQVPFEVFDTTSINAYVRTVRNDGTVSVTTPVAASIVPQNPGIYARDGTDPRPGVMMHGSSSATGTISVDGTANAGDTATVTIADRSYTYTVQTGDTLDSIRDALIALISQDPQVEAYAAGLFDRIRLRARVQGPEGNNIPIGASAPDGGQVIMTATNSHLCCANVAYSLVTDGNPAIPGETIIVYATGLGMPVLTDDVTPFVQTGVKYKGPVLNQPQSFVSSLAGGKTANVLAAGLKIGTVGTYEVHLELNSDLPTDPRTQLTIAQDVYVSNIVTFPVVNPADTTGPTTP
jgi:uncharacterized protein (TIGR03437 family)